MPTARVCEADSTPCQTVSKADGAIVRCAVSQSVPTAVKLVGSGPIATAGRAVSWSWSSCVRSALVPADGRRAARRRA